MLLRDDAREQLLVRLGYPVWVDAHLHKLVHVPSRHGVSPGELHRLRTPRTMRPGVWSTRVAGQRPARFCPGLVASD
jgi:hypothetical protein